MMLVRTNQCLIATLAFVAVIVSQTTCHGQSRDAIERFNHANHQLRLLQETVTWAELDCTQDQRDQLARISSRIQENHVEFERIANREGKEAAFQFLSRAVDDVLAAAKTEMLLPHQWDRFEQICFQMQIQLTNGNLASVLARGMGPSIDLSRAQIQEIRRLDDSAAEKIKEIEAETKEKIARIKDQLRSDVLSTLSSKQRDALDRAMGEPAFQASQTTTHASQHSIPKTKSR